MVIEVAAVFACRYHSQEYTNIDVNFHCIYIDIICNCWLNRFQLKEKNADVFKPFTMTKTHLR